MITITSVEARNRLGQLLDAAQRKPITITRRGRPVAVLMAVQNFQASQDRAVAARQAVAAFRGAGRGGTVEQLLADRRADGQRLAAAMRKGGTGMCRTSA